MATVKYPDGERTKVLKLRRIGSTRGGCNLYVAADVMKRMGWKPDDQLEVMEKDGVMAVWKREEEVPSCQNQ